MSSFSSGCKLPATPPCRGLSAPPHPHPAGGSRMALSEGRWALGEGARTSFVFLAQVPGEMAQNRRGFQTSRRREVRPS